jgi:hypothetical protein
MGIPLKSNMSLTRKCSIIELTNIWRASASQSIPYAIFVPLQRAFILGAILLLEALASR